ncbi:MAG: cbb3-type cytochrome oxidase assembly protein CcoS [Spirochaetota bacterium]
MNALFVTIPLAMAIAILAFVIFFMAWKKGQFEDMEGPKYRMFFDEENEISEKNNS